MLRNKIKDLFLKIHYNTFVRFYVIPKYFKVQKLKKDDVVIDCGAAFGEFTVCAAKKVGLNGKVIVFEPNPSCFKILKDKINKKKLKNVILIKKGLFNKNGKSKITENIVSGTIGSSMFPESSKSFSVFQKTGKSHFIDVATLDHEFEKLKIDKIDFIKMDIEGAELEAIEGAKQIIKKYHPHLAIACYHKRDGVKTGAILKPILERLGYSVAIKNLFHPTLFTE